MKTRLAFLLALLLLPTWCIANAVPKTWTFVVSGDSRNTGDVVMPCIAKGAHQHGAQFYWHLGDFRRISDFDEDMQHQPEHVKKPMAVIEYENVVWPDFIQNQIEPFGKTPVYLCIGNHELIPPKTRDDYLKQFADWLEQPVLKAQRLADDPHDHLLKAYFHWVQGGVDFISLDNGSKDQFDADQMTWLESLLKRDAADPQIRTLVVGMHKALPDSISSGHSMNESPNGTESGRKVYADLLQAQNEAHKRVYLLASHSHYYLEGIFNTEHWRTNGGVLPGWIVGTAGAQRNPLPAAAKDATDARTHVYGYLVGEVHPDGDIHFTFEPVAESDVPPDISARYTPEFVHWCFAENMSKSQMETH